MTRCGNVNNIQYLTKLPLHEEYILFSSILFRKGRVLQSGTDGHTDKRTLAITCVDSRTVCIYIYISEEKVSDLWCNFNTMCL
jgi:hypothetical protein